LNSTWLDLIDGGSNEEVIPLGQLFVRARGLDVVVAVDGSWDSNSKFPKVFVMSLSLSQAQSLSSVPTWQFFTYDSIKNHDFALVNPSIVPTAAWKHG